MDGAFSLSVATYSLHPPSPILSPPSAGRPCSLLSDPAPSSLTLLGSPGIGGAALALAGANSQPLSLCLQVPRCREKRDRQGRVGSQGQVATHPALSSGGKLSPLSHVHPGSDFLLVSESPCLGIYVYPSPCLSTSTLLGPPLPHLSPRHCLPLCLSLLRTLPNPCLSPPLPTPTLSLSPTPLPPSSLPPSAHLCTYLPPSICPFYTPQKSHIEIEAIATPLPTHWFPPWLSGFAPPRIRDE